MWFCANKYNTIQFYTLKYSKMLRLHLLVLIATYLSERSQLIGVCSSAYVTALGIECPGHDVKLHPHVHCHW